MTYRELLIEMVKAAGQEVIKRAEDLVGNGELMTDFDIWLRFPQGEIPTIECTRSYISKQSFDVYKELKDNTQGRSGAREREEA